MKSIFIDCNDQLDAVFARVYRPDDPPITVNTAPVAPSALPDLIAGYDICLDDHSYMPTELVARCTSLKHIVFLGTGALSYMDVPALAARGVTVHTIKGYGDRAVAEHAIALMFACTRGLARMDRLAQADVISLHLALNDDTRGIINAGCIARMKRGVILVNTARGALVEEAALIEGLRDGQIGSAGLDVFHAEPLKPDHPLAGMENVTLSSHAAFRTLEASMTLMRRAIDIVRKIVGMPAPA